jgi:hypothetical protein
MECRCLVPLGCRFDDDAPADAPTIVVGTYGGSPQIKCWVDGGGSVRRDVKKRPEPLAVKRMDESNALRDRADRQFARSRLRRRLLAIVGLR